MVSIRVPPLRDRQEDILLLIAYYNEKLSVQTGRPLLEFSGEAEDALKVYRWPGNVRELRNLVARLSLLARSPLVRLDDLPEEVLGDERPPARCRSTRADHRLRVSRRSSARR